MTVKLYNGNYKKSLLGDYQIFIHLPEFLAEPTFPSFTSPAVRCCYHLLIFHANLIPFSQSVGQSSTWNSLSTWFPYLAPCSPHSSHRFIQPKQQRDNVIIINTGTNDAVIKHLILLAARAQIGLPRVIPPWVSYEGLHSSGKRLQVEDQYQEIIGFLGLPPGRLLDQMRGYSTHWANDDVLTEVSSPVAKWSRVGLPTGLICLWNVSRAGKGRQRRRWTWRSIQISV